MTKTPAPHARRADAERNREAILDAAVRCLSDDPRASMSEIARAAGVGRVTMYGHFASRSELVEAVFSRTMSRAETALKDVDTGGAPLEALDRLVTASWRHVGDSRSILQAAEEELGVERVRQLHHDPLARVRRLVRRGRTSGAFRDDLPADWLVTCFFTVLHAAAEQVRSGRLSERAADRVVRATVGSLFRPVQP